jgi:hypothetical protein
MNVKQATITDIDQVKALQAVCNECMDEEFAENDRGTSLQGFRNSLHAMGWVQTEKFGLLCKKCAAELGVVRS